MRRKRGCAGGYHGNCLYDNCAERRKIDDLHAEALYWKYWLFECSRYGKNPLDIVTSDDLARGKPVAALVKEFGHGDYDFLEVKDPVRKIQAAMDVKEDDNRRALSGAVTFTEAADDYEDAAAEFDVEQFFDSFYADGPEEDDE